VAALIVTVKHAGAAAELVKLYVLKNFVPGNPPPGHACDPNLVQRLQTVAMFQMVRSTKRIESCEASANVSQS
jgi:hypothetical protein